MFKCEACGEPLIKGSPSISKGLCDVCDEQSTQSIKSALSNIRGKKRLSQEENMMKTVKKRKKCTPSDFIDSVFRFNDEQTGIPKVGLEFKVNDILNTLSSSNRGVEDRPTANYRTSLHTDTQNKSNLNKLLVAALKENGATDEEAQIFNQILESGQGLTALCELVRGANKTS